MTKYSKRKELARDKFLTPDECARLSSAPNKTTLQGLRDYAILKVFLNCGLRKQELIDLKVKDFCNEGTSWWFIVQSKGGTTDEQDIMNDRTIQAVQRYLQRAGHGLDADAPLFQPLKNRVRTDEKKINRRSIDYLVKRYAKKAEITKNITAHTLRHTFGTEFQVITGDIKSTQAAMRHRSLSSTMIYLHTNRDRVKRGLSQMNL